MTAYTDFVKMHFHDKKYAGMTPQQRMQKLAEEYRKGKPAMAKAPAKAPAKRTKKGAALSAGAVSAGGIGSDIGTAVDAIGSLFGLGLEKKKATRKRGGAMSAGEVMAGQESAGAVSAGRMRKHKKGDVRGSGAISSALASLLPF